MQPVDCSDCLVVEEMALGAAAKQRGVGLVVAVAVWVEVAVGTEELGVSERSPPRVFHHYHHLDPT
tara:strand:+ start:3569 stop:3766 length:198 start_codon:yes stop_codon:yes gene_type:complete